MADPTTVETIVDYRGLPTVEVHRIVVGPVDNNVYIVRCRETGDVRPDRRGQRARQAARLCRALGVRQVVETHGHWDHIQAVEAVRDAGIDVAVTAADAGMLPSYDQLLEDRSTLEVGRLAHRHHRHAGPHPGFDVLLASRARRCCSPATPSSPAGPGNTSFEHSDFATIIRSIEDRLFAPFGPDTIVLPGPRRGDHHRRRVTPPRRVDRAGLVSAAARVRPRSTGVSARGSARSPGGGRSTATPPATSEPTSTVTRDPASGIPSTLR